MEDNGFETVIEFSRTHMTPTFAPGLAVVRYSRYFSVFFICAGLWASSVRANDNAWRTDRAEALRAEADGRFPEAVKLWEKAVLQAGRLPQPNLKLAEALESLAERYLYDGALRKAELAIQRALRLREGVQGGSHPDLAHSLIQQSDWYFQSGQLAKAREAAERALAFQELTSADKPLLLADSQLRLARIHFSSSRHADAVSLLKRALVIRERILGAGHSKTAKILSELAEVLAITGADDQAEEMHKRALAIRERTLPATHPEIADSYLNLASVFVDRNKYADAEAAYLKALSIYENALGPGHAGVAVALTSLAGFYQSQRKLEQAAKLLERALRLSENIFGKGHLATASGLSGLALVRQTEGKYTDAEPLYKRALAIYEKALGPDSLFTAQTLFNQARLYQDQARLIEAEALLKRALSIYERNLGSNHRRVAISLNSLAEVMRNQGRTNEVEPLYLRSLSVLEAVAGTDDPDTASVMNNLGSLYRTLNRRDASEAYFNKALTIYEKTLGPEHPHVATLLNNLAGLKLTARQPDQAENLYLRSLAIVEKTMGANHPDTATGLNNLASLYHTQNQREKAEPLYRRASAIYAESFGPEHPDVALTLNNLARLYAGSNEPAEALRIVRQASAIYRNRLLAGANELSGAATQEIRRQRGVFSFHAGLIDWVDAGNGDIDLVGEAWEMAQLARGSDTAQALAGMAARFAQGSDELAKLVRIRQDILGKWRLADAAQIGYASRLSGERRPAEQAKLQSELVQLRAQLASIDTGLTQRFPEYRELTLPQPLPIRDAQKLLAPGEVMISYLVTSRAIYVWAVRNDAIKFWNVDLGAKDLSDRVQKLRQNLEPRDGMLFNQIKPFDTTLAHELYQMLVAPAQSILQGVTSLILVPDAALQSLPFAVLVMQEAMIPPQSLEQHREVSWLASKYALTVLPSESSLRALRRFAKSSTAPESFIGFGDPVLGKSEPGQSRGVAGGNLFTQRGVADVNEVRKLPRLPETAIELAAMGDALKSKKSDIHLQKAATETKTKRTDLSRYRTIAFSTHGLMAGDFKTLAEPALVLTPPETGSSLDDGLLTASEIAKLKLNADWVILSACNTAAADGTPGAEGLSGLAKAFFYAGSRALVVSHWSVSSDATVEIMTTMFGEAARGKGRAQALQRSMITLMQNRQQPHYAHPMFWAPFIIVGDGGTFKR